MSINPYKKGNQKFYQVFVKVRDCNQKQISKCRSGIKSLPQAKRVEFELRKELEFLAKNITHYTWRIWHEECLRRMKLSMKESTVMGYNGDLKKWIPQEWLNKNLSEFEKSDIFDLIFETMKETATPHIKRNVYKRIRRIFEMAVEDGILSRNPANGIKVTVPAAEKKVLNVTEAEILLNGAKAKGHAFYPIWAFALFTGMRSGEMLALQWKDIDLETGFISVNKQWTSKDGLHQTKSNRNRLVPIAPELKILLSDLKASGPYEDELTKVHRGVKVPIRIDELVLPRFREWKHGEAAKVLSNFCKELKITEVRFHDLRATFITNLLAQGTPLIKVMAIVGHSRMSTTDEYLRLAGVSLKGATEKLGYRLPRQEEANVIPLFRRE